MADVKISELPIASDITGEETIELVQLGTNKKVTIQSVLSETTEAASQLASAVDSMTDTVTQLSQDMNGLDSSVTQLTTDVNSTQSDVSQLSQDVMDVANAIVDLSTSVEVVEEAVATLRLTGVPQIGVVGDSRTAQNWNTSLTVPAANARGYLWYAQTLSQGRFDFSHVNNFGVSGDTIAQIKDRILNDTPNDYGNKWSTATPSLWILLAGTNSLNGGVFADMKADYTALLNKMLEKGNQVIVVAEWPRDSLNGDMSSLMYSFAEWLRRLRTTPGVQVLDVWPDIADPASTSAAPLTGYLSDGTHGSPGLAYVMAKKLVTMISHVTPEVNWCTSSNGDVYNATTNVTGNLVSNPMLTQGSGGTVGSNGAGVVPQGWALSAQAGLTATGSFVTTSNGKPAFRITVTGTPNSTNAYVDLRQSGLQSSVASGDIIRAGYKYEVSTGHTNFAAAGVMIDPGTTLDRVHGGLTTSGDPAILPTDAEAFVGVSQAPRYTVPSPVPASLALNARIYFPASAESALTIDILNVFARKE